MNILDENVMHDRSSAYGIPDACSCIPFIFCIFNRQLHLQHVQLISEARYTVKWLQRYKKNSNSKLRVTTREAHAQIYELIENRRLYINALYRQREF